MTTPSIVGLLMQSCDPPESQINYSWLFSKLGLRIKYPNFKMFVALAAAQFKNS